MKIKYLALAVALCSAPALAMACELPANAQGLVTDALHSVNAERSEAGLAPLNFSRTLAKAAQKHACDTAERNKMGHMGSDGSGVGERAKAVGYSYSILNENVADVPHHWDVVEAWMGSHGHKVNILTPSITEVGFGIAMAQNGKNIHWVMKAAAPLR